MSAMDEAMARVMVEVKSRSIPRKRTDNIALPYIEASNIDDDDNGKIRQGSNLVTACIPRESMQALMINDLYSKLTLSDPLRSSRASCLSMTSRLFHLVVATCTINKLQQLPR